MSNEHLCSSRMRCSGLPVTLAPDLSLAQEKLCRRYCLGLGVIAAAGTALVLTDDMTSRGLLIVVISVPVIVIISGDGQMILTKPDCRLREILPGPAG